MLNKAILTGRLTRDPEIKYLQNSTPVASFVLAVERTFKNKDGEKEADFIPVVAWRNTAELCGKYLNKGDMCSVVGRIQVRSYDLNDGGKRYVTEVVADEVHFIGSKSDSQKTNDSHPIDGFEEIDDLDVPF